MGWAVLLNDGDFFKKKRYSYRKEGYSEITVASDEQGRLDLIAQRNLGDKEYWWIIAEVNNLMDPINEVVPGMIIKIPYVSDIAELNTTLDDAIEVNNPSETVE